MEINNPFDAANAVVPDYIKAIPPEQLLQQIDDLVGKPGGFVMVDSITTGKLVVLLHQVSACLSVQRESAEPEICPMCSNTGCYPVGHSGSDTDGNGSVFEDCECDFVLNRRAQAEEVEGLRGLLDEGVKFSGQLLGDIAKLRAELAALKLQLSQRQQVGFPWDAFPAYLIDHCEGETITEESLQYWVGQMSQLPQYMSAPPSPVQEDVPQQGETK